ncbi:MULTISPECIES: GNAT family N-acetyltransferase [Rhizobium]|uniref:RimJ/RimL family protein N-acetyltransferase n=1 Tax=Rhizobium paranaense TaxID=1650438 RepID=A0A7W8XME9_9HYPH|nr:MULTISPECIES: GNAT family N-acetyltransferase [Rhizobium]MBB5572098.1 RimJ/RimL family protein N-acetyltransferase [Rhizobium paranaense]PST63191.1 GNAT family N-acetyltransferase [Rhizobium sp. SEMIA4064]
MRMNAEMADKKEAAPAMTIIPTLMTERLILRSHRLEDFEEYTAFWSQEDLVRYIGGETSTREQAWSRMLRYAGMWHHLGFGFFAVEERHSGRFIGEVGFLDLHRDMYPTTTEGTLEAGWGITPALQGKGYATEAVSAAIAWAEETFPGRRMTCIIDPENAPSQRVAEKVGFRRIGEVFYKDKPNVMFER